MAKPSYEELEKRVRMLEERENRLKSKMNSMSRDCAQPDLKADDGFTQQLDRDALKLSDVIDAGTLQSMMDDFHALTNFGIAILDTQGNILVATGWQDICTEFHRKHPEALKNCLNSDIELANEVQPGTFRLYRCKNNMWDMATPIAVGGKRLGSIYLGQFIFEDETPDLELFRSQAKKYGFDEDSYLEALKRVPRWTRENVNRVMSFYAKLANLISELSYSNIRLAGTLKERTHILKKLEKRERFLNEMGRMSKIGGWEHDLVSRKAFWTQGIYDIMGLKNDVEPPGVDEHLKLYASESRKMMESAYRDTAGGGPPFDLELEVISVSGKRLWCRVYGEAVMAGGKCVRMRGVFQDISERRHMQQELARARRLESMGILAGGLAHDYNNLLSMILGNISMARDDINFGRSIGGFLDDAEEATIKAKELTHRLMTLANAGGSHKRLRSVKDTLEICAGEISGISNCVCKVNIRKDLWPVEHDPFQFKYAIRNVLRNAVEAMRDGGLLRLKADNVIVENRNGISNLPETPGAYLNISVVDEGSGIDDGDMGRIFDPYFSTKEMGAREGMGLGLAIAHAIINNHGGQIFVDSAKGVGTTVEIYLPARPPSGHETTVSPGPEKEAVEGVKPSPQAKKHRKMRAAKPSKKRILVMDDEKKLREIARQMLERLGYEVVLAKDGNEAILQYETAMASGNYFDAVILDLTVRGGMGGREAVKRLIKMDSGVRAIVSSGYRDDPVLKSYEDHGFRASMPKPYKKEDLARVLSRVLDNQDQAGSVS